MSSCVLRPASCVFALHEVRGPKSEVVESLDCSWSGCLVVGKSGSPVRQRNRELNVAQVCIECEFRPTPRAAERLRDLGPRTSDFGLPKEWSCNTKNTLPLKQKLWINHD